MNDLPNSVQRVFNIPYADFCKNHLPNQASPHWSRSDRWLVMLKSLATRHPVILFEWQVCIGNGGDYAVECLFCTESDLL